jgi:hypothetical protein
VSETGRSPSLGSDPSSLALIHPSAQETCPRKSGCKILHSSGPLRQPDWDPYRGSARAVVHLRGTKKLGFVLMETPPGMTGRFFCCGGAPGTGKAGSVYGQRNGKVVQPG